MNLQKCRLRLMDIGVDVDAPRDHLMFLMIFTRPAPTFSVWAGRRLLAAVDAVAWPALWGWLAFTRIPHGGLAVRWVVAVLVCLACRRLWRAVADNEHYGFVTVRWAKLLLCLWIFGYALKLVM
jgi:hypothetical protein